MISKLKKKRKSKAIRSLSHFILAFILMINIIAPTIAYAATAEKVPGLFGDPLEVWYDDDGKEPDSSVEKGGFEYASASDIYGRTVNYPHYRGEVSVFPSKYYNNRFVKICGKNTVDIRLFHQGDDIDENAVETDIRVHCLANQLGSVAGWFRGIGAGLANAIRGLQVGTFEFVVSIKELNLKSIFNMFFKKKNGEDTLVDKITSVLIYDSKKKTLSPFLVIFIILWVLGMIGVSIKYIKGQTGFELIKRELLFIILSIVLFAAAISSGGPDKISELSIKISDILNEAISDPKSNDIFSCNYSDKHQQLVSAQTAIFAKANIDSSLCCIFGCDSISDLNLKIPSEYSDTAVVSNGKSKNTTNIGYMLWAGQSYVDNRAPSSDGKLKYIPAGDKNNIHWLIPDILEHNGGMKNNTMIKYADRLNSKTTWSYFGMGLLFMLVSIPFIITEIFAVFVVMVGKVILTISGLMLLVLPAFFLWERSRNLAKDICRSYIGAFIRVVIGDLLFIVFLEMFSIMTQDSDPVSTLMAMLIFIVAMLLMPTKIMPAINNMLYEIEGNGSIASVTRRFSEAGIDRMSRIVGYPANKTIDKIKEARARRKQKKEEEERDKNPEDEERRRRNTFASINRISDEDEHDGDVNTTSNSETDENNRENVVDSQISNESSDSDGSNNGNVYIGNVGSIANAENVENAGNISSANGVGSSTNISNSGGNSVSGIVNRARENREANRNNNETGNEDILNNEETVNNRISNARRVSESENSDSDEAINSSDNIENTPNNYNELTNSHDKSNTEDNNYEEFEERENNTSSQNTSSQNRSSQNISKPIVDSGYSSSSTFGFNNSASNNNNSSNNRSNSSNNQSNKNSEGKRTIVIKKNNNQTNKNPNNSNNNSVANNNANTTNNQNKYSSNDHNKYSSNDQNKYSSNDQNKYSNNNTQSSTVKFDNGNTPKVTMPQANSAPRININQHNNNVPGVQSGNTNRNVNNTNNNSNNQNTKSEGGLLNGLFKNKADKKEEAKNIIRNKKSDRDSQYNESESSYNNSDSNRYSDDSVRYDKNENRYRNKKNELSKKNKTTNSNDEDYPWEQPPERNPWESDDNK